MAFPYVVQQGDTLYRIARRFGINLTSLYSANPQISGQQYIYPGQLLQIPAPAARTYVVQPGDSFYLIARKFSLPLDQLIEANPGVDPQRLYIGQTIVLPQGSSLNIVDTTNEYGYAEMMEDIDLLKQAYPFLETGTIGTSVLGCSIPYVRIGSGDNHVHYNGSFHANEWITTVVLMKFIEDYAAAYAKEGLIRGREAKPLFERTSLWIVPMVNPDGVELVLQGVQASNDYTQQLIEWNNGSLDFSGWKSNIRGVDLNDQFPANWEAERDRRAAPGPGPRDYTGTAPLTEPEAAAMAAFTRNHNFKHVMAFHTQGREIYWNYRDLEPPEAEQQAQRLAQVSGYRAVKFTDSDAGYKDWFIQEYRRPGFTIEAGIGVNPLPISQFRSIYDETIGIMLEGLLL